MDDKTKSILDQINNRQPLVTAEQLDEGYDILSKIRARRDEKLLFSERMFIGDHIDNLSKI